MNADIHFYDILILFYFKRRQVAVATLPGLSLPSACE